MLAHSLNSAAKTFTMPTSEQFITYATNAIRTEQAALELLIEQLDDRFVEACKLILGCEGRVVVTGMGKSGHIGRKIAATFASTGSPAFFMHPGEAGHGDLGMLVQGDVLLAISNSGESDEIKTLLPVVKQLSIPLISISRDKRGRLAQFADVALTLGPFEEACPLGLAPTSSTTATLALGDAMAVALVYARNFTSEDFALSHPAGALGRKLLMRVSDLMHVSQEGWTLPTVLESTSLHQALFTMTNGRLGMAVIVNEAQQVQGVFTDGDLRRALERHLNLETSMDAIMTPNPQIVAKDMRASDALSIMNAKAINQLIIVDEHKRLQGIVTIHDLIQAGVT